MEEKIQIRIYPDGRIEAETLGIKGERCTDMIPVLESLLNAEAVQAEYTEEFYETAVETVELREQQNIIKRG
ncbi:DUF2997 domain-containing protein [Paenibacillus sp. CN-4]|uniref:DUF2997 domain-containing protein n=1 Tax=Paenibacillus nanchangensis TaxID=3348343 RepID=UPI003978FBF5